MVKGPAKIAVDDAQFATRINSDPAEIAAVRKSAEQLAATHGFDECAVGEIGLCVNEALANIIRHAYFNQHDKPIDIDATVRDDLFDIRIRDWGTGVTPKTKTDKAAHELIQPGGLGLPCLSKMMDEINFIPQSDGMLLHMTKRRR